MHREASPSVEPTVKSARVLPVIVYVATVAMLALMGAPVRAAGPVETVAGSEWSPRIRNWSGSEARSLGLGRNRLNNLQSRLVTILDGSPVRYRLTISQHQIDIRLTTAF